MALVALAGTLAGTLSAPVASHAGEAGLLAVEDAQASSRPGITVRVHRTTDGYEVEGRCTTTATRTTAWNVLTDYDAIDDFVSSMRESRITKRSDGHLLVEQTAVGRLFMFSRRMTVILFVHEEPRSGVIHFEDVLRQDFALYRGEWRIQDHGGRREIHYRVSARPAFRVPDVVARGMFSRTARELLSQVEAEMSRRAVLAAAGEQAARGTSQTPASAPE